jgi:hypothetical protein
MQMNETRARSGAARARRRDPLRVFLVNWLWTTIFGLRVSEWLRLLRRHRFAVDPPYWPRAALITATSLITSAIGWYEDRVYGPRVAHVTIKQPLFIVGHGRSGTTLLYHLLTVDQRFAYPNLWQALNPHTFLTTERFAHWLRFLMPKTRLVDNISSNMALPFEDQFATRGSLYSPFLRSVFPRSPNNNDRYLTFRDVPAAEVAEWQAALRRFYQKLTWKYNRPLLLKSPSHTGRVKMLLELFTDARFIHIYRNPYAVFRSARRFIDVRVPTVCLQRMELRDQDCENMIIERYQRMYEAYFAERSLIPPGRLVELRYEDLVQDPLDQLQRIYEQLDLPDFAVVRPAIERYIASLGEYRPNTYAEISPDLRATLAREWRRNFELWGYPYQEGTEYEAAPA